jgi:hypothetical protein
MSILKNQMKSTGDTHLAEVESQLPVEGGSPIGLGTRGMQTTRVGHGVKKAGIITDGEPPASDDSTDTSEEKSAN